jgi:hypothetical protein
MKYAEKEVEIRVEPFSESKSHYAIYYRVKKRFNLFNGWKRYEYCWTLSVQHFDCNQPHLYGNFEDALKTANRLKADPSLIDENNQRRIEKYNDCKRELQEYLKSRNKSITI